MVDIPDVNQQEDSMKLVRLLLAATLGCVFAASAWSADTCKNRGELDAQFCDDDQDMVADAPKDPTTLRVARGGRLPQGGVFIGEPPT